eukprot:Pompholyxophrys_punicea_v1_NODE_760_length_1330_cov_2.484706.p1 type:complete len:387 gc:universal NODE_760_length_1330_cov_2.484706:133-1293(+)
MPSNEDAPITQYILMFLYRSACYSFQIIGPHYSSERPMNSRFIAHCLSEFALLLYCAGFRPYITIVDGASTNLSTIKHFIDDQSAKDTWEICPKATNFLNHFGWTMWFMICPPHMMKNMINALHSSQAGRTKSFLFDNVIISYKFIIDAFYREKNRAEAGEIRKIPRLDWDCVFKNSWNAMSIPNNKVLLHGELTAEMRAHMNITKDYAASKTVEYLEKMEQVFRDVFLNKNCIVYSLDALGFDRLNDTDEWLRRWKINFDDKIAGSDLPIIEKNKYFLAWQTLDLWKIMREGFIGFCRDFLERHGHHHPPLYIKPMRFSGSPLELLFCSLKQMKNSAGMLNEIKLEDAKASLLVQKFTGNTKYNQYHDDTVDAEEGNCPLELRRK